MNDRASLFDDIDSMEPDRFARLRADAQALEEKWPAPADRPPLFGVGVGVKDIMRVDGLPTTAGSQATAGLLGAHQHGGKRLVVDEADLGHAVEHSLGHVVGAVALAQLVAQLLPAARRHRQLPQHDLTRDVVGVGLVVALLEVLLRIAGRLLSSASSGARRGRRRGRGR